jgi:cytochrome c biogenesis factor
MIKRGTLDESIPESHERSPLSELINDRSLMFLTLIILVITTIITLLLLILAINGADRLQFDSKIGLFAMVGINVLAICLSWKLIGRTISFILLMAGGAIATVFIILLMGRNITTDDLAQYVAWVTIAFSLLALGACTYKIVKSVNRRSLRGTINNISPHLVHLGVALLLLGFVGSNFFVTEREITLTFADPSAVVGDYEIRLEEIESSSESIFARVEIYRDGNKIGEARPGAIIIDGQLRNEIDVMGTPFEDIYLVYVDSPSSSTVILTVKILPLMSFVWGGMWLLAAGIGIRLIVDYTRPKTVIRGETRVQRRARMRGYKEPEEPMISEESEEPVDIDEKSDEYYEDLIERELKEME